MTIRFNGVRIKPCATGGGGGSSATYIQPVGDPQVSLLLHMDGANNSTTFVDESYIPKTITTYGNAKISTSQSKFGGASGAFDGSGDYLLLDNTADLAFGSGAFTIEGWVYLNSVSYQTIFAKHTPGVTGDFGFFINNSTSLLIGLNNTPGGFVRTVPTISANTWYHFAMVGNGSGTVKIYWDGTQAGADIAAASINNDVPKWIIGADQWSSPTHFLNGYLDEFRITKGLARYTSNFTPPVAAFPNADPVSNLPTNPAVGDVAYSSTKAYVCTSVSPVTWKEYSSTGVTYTP